MQQHAADVAAEAATDAAAGAAAATTTAAAICDGEGKVNSEEERSGKAKRFNTRARQLLLEWAHSSFEHE